MAKALQHFRGNWHGGYKHVDLTLPRLAGGHHA